MYYKDKHCFLVTSSRVFNKNNVSYQLKALVNTNMPSYHQFAITFQPKKLKNERISYLSTFSGNRREKMALMDLRNTLAPGHAVNYKIFLLHLNFITTTGFNLIVNKIPK